MDGVDAVIGRGDGAGELELVLLDQGHRVAQHRLDAVAQVQRLAHRAGQRLGGAVEHGGIEMARLCDRLGRWRCVGQ